LGDLRTAIQQTKPRPEGFRGLRGYPAWIRTKNNAPKCVVLLGRSRRVAILLLFRGRWNVATSRCHSIASNDGLLHLGHLPAASSVTGRVKCFMQLQSLHFHRMERCSSASWSCFRAYSARSRIVSRAALSGFNDAWAVNSVQVAGDACVAYVARSRHKKAESRTKAIRRARSIDSRVRFPSPACFIGKPCVISSKKIAE